MPAVPCFESRDDGESWSQRTRFGWNGGQFARQGRVSGWIAGIHAPFVVLMDGGYLAFGRRNDIADRAPFSLSSDGGLTWTYQPSLFPPIASAQRPILRRLAEGPILLISQSDPWTNYQAKQLKGIEVKDASGRLRRVYGTFAALSFDEGKTWPVRKLIPRSGKTPYESDPTGYLSCVQTPDRLIRLVSSHRYYCFNLPWLMEPIASSPRVESYHGGHKRKN